MICVCGCGALEAREPSLRNRAFEENPESNSELSIKIKSSSTTLCSSHSFRVFPKGAKQLPFCAFSVPLVAFATMASVTSSAQVRSLRRASLEATIVGEQILFATSLVSSSRRSSPFFFLPRSAQPFSSLPSPPSLTSITGHAPRDEDLPIR